MMMIVSSFSISISLFSRTLRRTMRHSAAPETGYDNEKGGKGELNH